jgi:hypothetical protein
LAAEVDRRAAFGQIAVSAALLAGLPQVASADGASSNGTIQKARFIYGGRVANLEKAVQAGDFDAVAAEKSAFVLFNSGAYPGAKRKDAKNAAIKSTNDIFSAIRAKDKSALTSAYKTYVVSNKIVATPVVDPNSGQGYSGDFDYRVRTSAA